MNAEPRKREKQGRKPLVALTGATGFIGQYLLKELPKRGYRLRVLWRRPTTLPSGCASAVIGDLAKPYNMSEALADVDAVIHTAGLAETMSGVPEDDYRLFNTEATIGFAKAAERARVNRFVFLSSIRAQSGPTADRVLTEEHEPAPTDPYGRSKLAAEQGLRDTGLDWVALRLALVYGPGVQGNMAKLAKLARSPYPLPLAGLKASTLSLPSTIWSRRSKGSDRPCPTEAPAHRRRSETPHYRCDHRRHAPRPRAAPRWSMSRVPFLRRASARRAGHARTRRSSARSSPILLRCSV